MDYDILIVGAGPAGLGAAYSLMPYTSRFKICILEKSSIFGGAGGNTDNKWNLLKKNADSVTGFWHMLEGEGGVWSREYVENMCLYGASVMERLLSELDLGNLEWHHYNSEAFTYWSRKAKAYNLSLEPLEQFHIGSSRGRAVMQYLGKTIEKSGIKVHFKTEVNDVNKTGKNFIVKTNKGNFRAKYVILAPGRSHAKFGEGILNTLKESLGIELKINPIDIGLRVEFLPESMKEITTWKGTPGMYDPKFRLVSARGDTVRTFCGNIKGGKLVIEKAGGLPFVNGASDPKLYGNPANVAVLESVSLEEPYNNSIEWAWQKLMTMSFLSTRDDKQRVLIQRMGDFLGPTFYEMNPKLCQRNCTDKSIRLPRVDTWRYRRSRFTSGKSNSFDRFNDILTTTLRVDNILQGTPGDFHMAFNSRIMDNIRDMILALGGLFPGILHPSTVLAGPEIKFYAQRAVADKWSETGVENFYVAGDGGRGTHGICPSFVNGLNAAQGILLKNKIKPVVKLNGKEIQINEGSISCQGRI